MEFSWRNYCILTSQVHNVLNGCDFDAIQCACCKEAIVQYLSSVKVKVKKDECDTMIIGKLQMWYLHSLESVSVIQKLTLLECKMVLFRGSQHYLIEDQRNFKNICWRAKWTPPSEIFTCISLYSRRYQGQHTAFSEPWSYCSILMFLYLIL